VTTPEEQQPPEELGRLEQLRYLWVGHHGLAKPEVLSLQAALPACRVSRGAPGRVADDYDWS
jgi:hypothetical protein